MKHSMKWVAPPSHPAAELLPIMSDDELAELAADIEVNGLQQPITLFRDNTQAANGSQGPFPVYVLDGRNRLAALQLLGISDPHKAKHGQLVSNTVRTVDAMQESSLVGGRSSRTLWTVNVNPTTFVLSANVRRRHLTSAQKRQAIVAFINADPIASDRKVGRELGVTGTTVADVRRDQNAGNLQNDHSPRTRAETVILANPELSQRAIALEANVAQSLVSKVRKELIESGELVVEGKPAPSPTPKPQPQKKIAGRSVDHVGAAESTLRKLIAKHGIDVVETAWHNIQSDTTRKHA